MKSKHKNIIIFLSLIFGIGIWIIDSYLDSAFFYHSSFWDLLIFHIPPRELYIRLITFIFIIGFGYLIHRLVKKILLTEEKLTESEKNYRTVADYTFDWEYWLSPEGNYKYISPSCKYITGYDIKNFINDKGFIERIIHPDDLDLYLNHIQKHITTNKTEKIEFRIIKANGEEQWIHHVCQPIVDEKGQFLGIRASNRDITDRVHMEKILEENIHFLQVFLDNIPIPIYYKDKDKQYIACNFAYEKSFGVSQNEIIGKTAFDIHPRELAEKYEEMDNELLENKKDQVYENQVKFADGSLRDVVFHKSLLTKLDGTLTGLIGIFFDITERKKNEEIIIESEIKYRSLFENMLNSFSFFKIIYENETPVDYILMEANTSFENIVKMEYSEIIGKSIKKIFAQVNEFNPEWEKYFYPVAFSGTPLRFEHYFSSLQKWFLISVYKPKDNFLATIFSDITEQKTIEKTLALSLEKYKVLFYSFPLGIIILDTNSSILESNREAERLFEKKLENGSLFDYRSSDWEVIRTDGSLMPREEFAHALSQKQHALVQNIEMGFIKDNKSILWLNVNAAPIPIQDYGIAVTFSDISSRKIIQRELEYERFLLSTLMNTVPDNIFFKDRKSRYIRVNKALAGWYGLSDPTEIYGKTDADFFSQDYTYAAFSDEQKLIKGEISLIRKEEKELWLDGRTGWVSTIKVPFRDKDNFIIGIIGISRDITEKKKMEKAITEKIIALTQPLGDFKNITFETLFDLAEIQKIQDAFAEATGVASIILNELGKPLTNPSNYCFLCSKIIQKTEVGLKNCIQSDVAISKFSPDGPIHHHCIGAGLMDGGASISIGDHHIASWLIGQVIDDRSDMEQMLEYADEIGVNRQVYWNALHSVRRMPKEQFKKICNALYLIAKHLSTMAVQNIQQARNISERIQAEERAIKLNEEISLKNRELEQIVYVTSHDLRSPLVNIQGFSKEIENSFKLMMQMIVSAPSLDKIKDSIINYIVDDIPESLHYILASTSKMDSLLKGLLKLSRMGRNALNIKALDMNSIINAVLKVFEYQIQEKHINIELSDLPPCRGDDIQIDQLFSNFIDNAIKYIGNIKEPQIKIFGRKIDKNSLYCIEDNGMGIAPEHHEKIFEIFYRLNTEISAGEGIGLTIARKIIERHNGKIWVESQIKHGSRFYILLPNE